MGLDLYLEAKNTEKATGRCISACDPSYTESPPALTERGFCGMIYEGNFGTVSVRPHKFIRLFSN